VRCDDGIVITNLVMAFAKLSATHKDTVSPHVERINNKQVGCCITTPVAQETDNSGLK
jgi:hypothetical protein